MNATTAAQDRGRIGALSDELAEAHAQLAELQRHNVQLARLATIERVAASLTHELNQPLTAIVNYICAGQRLMADSFAPDLNRLAAVLEGAKSQSQHASLIVDRLRDFVAHGETETRIEPLADIVTEAVSLCRHLTEANGVQVSLALDPAGALVMVDRVQIEQVLINLMRNAVQAMQECPRRILSIASQAQPNMVEISVQDTGRGLADEVRDRLFEPLVTTRRGGMGLGLAICRTIVEGHGGTLSWEPAPDGGSLFRFTLPNAVDPLP